MVDLKSRYSHVVLPRVYVQASPLIKARSPADGRSYIIGKEVEVEVSAQPDGGFAATPTGEVRYRCLDLDVFVAKSDDGRFIADQDSDDAFELIVY